MFKDFITAVRSCHAFQIFNHKTRIPPTPLQLVVTVGPFAKWRIDFMTCNLTSAGGHGYIIVAVDYFTKWVELVYGLEEILSVQCEISSLKLAVNLLLGTSEEEARFLELIQLKRVKAQFDKNVKPRVFLEGDLVLLYDQESDKLGAGKFQSLWMAPYIVKRVLAKGAYELVDYDKIPLSQPQNGLYLKRYYA
eukprot:PITA_07991